MFNKNSFVKLEVLPDGQHLITTQVDKNTNIESFVDLINNFLSREYLEVTLESILEKSKKNKSLPTGEEICHVIINTQNQIEIRPINKNKRNPIIRASQAIKDEIEHE